jgi:hypothetical protein
MSSYRQTILCWIDYKRIILYVLYGKKAKKLAHERSRKEVSRCEQTFQITIGRTVREPAAGR